ncbi:type I restriction endonuclease subunit R [Vibrio palustris]|nr:type I restriction endonuclease subunit R [Vibrio palustris]
MTSVFYEYIIKTMSAEKTLLAAREFIIMSKQSENLKIGLLDNGSHSLKRGFEMWTQWEESEDAWLLKEAVIWVHHGIELVLKQLLVQTNEFLVFQDVNKAVERLGILRNKRGMKNAGILDLFDHDDKVMSVGFRSLIERAAITLSISELEEGGVLRSKIDRLTRYRNKIVHFSLELDVIEVSSLLSDLLNPLLSVLAREINDHNFKQVVIPKIMKLAQPIQKYLEFVRSNIVDSAITATKQALPPKGSGKAGVVVQVMGSGLSISLLMYLKEIRELCALKDYSVVILVDRKILESQLLKAITENSDICPMVPSSKGELIELLNSNLSNVIITTIQKVDPNYLADKNTLFIGYNLLPGTEKLLSFSSIGVRILFTNILSPRDIEIYGDIVGMYDLQQAMLDDVLKPIKIEKIEFPLDQVDSYKQIDQEMYELSDGFDYIHRSPPFLKTCALKIIQHFELRKEVVHGKAIIIVRDLDAATLLLECILELRPDWREEDIRNMVVSTISSRNSFDESNFILNTFQDKDSSLSLLIGTGSYLIGYDNRYINTVYVTCPISNQLQYRLVGLTSRYDEGKSENIIVDFIGLDWSIK